MAPAPFTTSPLAATLGKTITFLGYIGPGNWPQLLRSRFLVDASGVWSGQAAALVLGILSAPSLGRLFTPADYGALAVYTSIGSLLAAIGSWQYAQAIIAETSDRNALRVGRLCFFTSGMTGLLAVVAVALILALRPEIVPDRFRIWFLSIPAMAFTSGMIGALLAVANRFRRYRALASLSLSAAVLTVGTSVVLGALGWGPDGLLTAYVLGQVYQLGFLTFVHIALPTKISRVRLSSLLALARKHRKFAIWTTPSSLIGMVGLQAPIYALSLMSAPSMVGAFSRANLIFVPLALLGSAVNQVFRQRAAADLAAKGTCLPLFNKSALLLFAVGVPPAVAIMVFAPAVFRVFLGENWEIAGDVARVLAPMILLQVISAPLAAIYYLKSAQKEDFWVQLTFSLATAGCIAALFSFGAGPLVIVAGYAGCQSFMHAYYIFRSFQMAIERQ